MSRVTVTDEQIHAAQAGDGDAMWEIVQEFDGMFTGMIRSVASTATKDHAEDLLQEARAVLIQHVRDYDTEASSASLTSYVFQAARRRIQEEHIKATTHLTVDPTAVLRVRRALWHADGNADKAWESLSTCSSAAGRMERERFMAVVEALAGTMSLDMPVDDRANGSGNDGAVMTLADVIADPSSEISDPAERRDLARWLMTQIAQRQAFALRAFFGIGMSQQDDAQTCADLGVKPARLRVLRHDGVNSARRVASIHGIAA
jgi:RNA polymerase primary sigma factor